MFAQESLCGFAANQPTRLTLQNVSLECRQVASVQSPAGHEGGKR